MDRKENKSMSLPTLPTKHPKRRERIPESGRREAFFVSLAYFVG